MDPAWGHLTSGWEKLWQAEVEADRLVQAGWCRQRLGQADFQTWDRKVTRLIWELEIPSFLRRR